MGCNLRQYDQQNNNTAHPFCLIGSEMDATIALVFEPNIYLESCCFSVFLSLILPIKK